MARNAIRQVKNAWFQAKVDEAQRQHFRWKVVCKCIWDMQKRACRGFVPSKVITIYDESGEPCSTQASRQQHWRRHFHQGAECEEPVSTCRDGEGEAKGGG